MNKDEIFADVKSTYTKLLPDISESRINEALENCYEDGMTAYELKKATYAYLYPLNNQTLW